MSDPAALMALASRLHEENRRRRRKCGWLRISLQQTCTRLCGRTRLLPSSEAAVAHPHFIFRAGSLPIEWWDTFLILGVVYSTAYAPLCIVFPEARWKHHGAVDILLDVLFCLDMVIRCRTSFRDHGYDVTSPYVIARHYFKGWFTADFLSSVPIDRIIIAFTNGQLLSPLGDHSRIEPITCADVVSLLRVLRTGRLVRKLSTLNGANFLRVCYLMYLFVLCGHFLGLIWYVIAIRPIEDDATYDSLEPWLWTVEESQSAYFVALRYVCSLHWALSVMTNLKGINAHETRQCLFFEPSVSFVLRPLAERIFSIVVFIIGAMLFSCIYGNINQFISNLYASGLRYRKRMEELDEFAKFHRLSPQLRIKIRNYVDFQWSVTKGINVDTIAAGLPAHLQIEMRLQLNKRLVENVTIFQGCPREFFEALVQRLQPCICIAGDFVFYECEIGSRMYFIKRGTAQVLGQAGSIIVATVSEGDYFGEVSLLTDQPRTASVLARTDLMLLSLSSNDLEAVLSAYPQAAARIELAAKERLKTFNSGATTRRGSSGGRLGSSLFGSRIGSRSNSLSRAPTCASLGRRMSHQLRSIPRGGSVRVSPVADEAPAGAGSAIEHRRPSLEDGFKAEAAGDLLSSAERQTPVTMSSTKSHRRCSLQCNLLPKHLQGSCKARSDPQVGSTTGHRRTSLSQAHAAADNEERATTTASMRGRRASQFAATPEGVAQAPNGAGGRRRSVDSGLTICFNEQRRAPLLLAARAAQAAMSSRRGSLKAPIAPLRQSQSLDCGWDSADDHRRRQSLSGRQAVSGSAHLLSDSLVLQACQALEAREQRRISRASNMSSAIIEHDGIEQQICSNVIDDPDEHNHLLSSQGTHGQEQDFEKAGCKEHPHATSPDEGAHGQQTAGAQSDEADDAAAAPDERERDAEEPSRLRSPSVSRRASCAALRRGSCTCVIPLAELDDFDVEAAGPPSSEALCGGHVEPSQHQSRCKRCSYGNELALDCATAARSCTEGREASPARRQLVAADDLRVSTEPTSSSRGDRRTSLSIPRGVRQPVAKAAAKFFRSERRRSTRASCSGPSSAAAAATASASNSTTLANVDLSQHALVKALKAQLSESLAPIFKHQNELKAQQDDLWKEMKVISDKINQLYSGKWM